MVMEVMASHILKALIDHGKDIRFQLTDTILHNDHNLFAVWRADFKKTNMQKCTIMITASLFKRTEIVHMSTKENRLKKQWCNPLLDHQVVIQKNEAESYVITWKDAHDILLTEQKGNDKTKW